MSHVLANSDVRQVAAEAGMRLDRALADALPDLSRSRIKQLILGGLVSTAGATITDPSYRVKPAEIFSVTVPQPTEIALVGEDIPLDIIFEDESLLVIDKPAGLTVHPGAGQPSGTLVNALIAHCGNSLSGIGGVKRPGIVHRLDKNTSGLIVVAKSDIPPSRDFALPAPTLPMSFLDADSALTLRLTRLRKNDASGAQ